MELMPLPKLRCHSLANSNYSSLSDAKTHEPLLYIDRHHADACAPYWVYRETRKDAAGRRWQCEAVLMVPDEFGDLLKVSP